jgi:nicotinamide-nucleotide amidase
VLLTGSELARGSIADGNGAYLAASLTGLGFDPIRMLVVGDREDELAAAMAEALEAELCVSSGGLGPTHDDRTVELLARLTGRRLVLDDALEGQIASVSREAAARLARPYREFEPGVRKQASVPEGALVLGLAGTAPGLLLEHEPRRVAVVLPGPPGELRRLWPRALERPELTGLLGDLPDRRHRLLRFFGPSESSVADALAAAGGEGGGLEVTVCARDYEIHVDLLAEPAGAGRLAEVESALRSAFGSGLFADDDRPVEDTVLGLARDAGVTIATAESCTGGLVAARLTAVPGASEAYRGGAVAYADDVKQELLGVPAEIVRQHGAVSAETAAAMARGARDVFGADVAVAVTGIAGPGGGTPEKPVGLVYVHVAAPGGDESQRLELPGDRERVRGRATAVCLHALRRVLSHGVRLSRA